MASTTRPQASRRRSRRGACSANPLPASKCSPPCCLRRRTPPGRRLHPPRRLLRQGQGGDLQMECEQRPGHGRPEPQHRQSRELGQRLNFTGTCAIVPSLKAPGFITAVAGNQFDLGDAASWKDVSGCEGAHDHGQLGERVRRLAAELRPRAPHRRKVLRVRLQVALHAVASAAWAPSPSRSRISPTSGTTRPASRSACAETPRYCPDAKTLANMKTMSIWAEGVEGDVSILVESIEGYGCK